MNFQFIVKTFERPESVKLLLESIETFYPEARVWIADDSERPQATSTNPNHTFLPCPFDIGLKCGRQVAMACVTTPYFVLLDDDFILTSDSKVETLVETIERLGLDFCGGEVFDGPDKGSPRSFTGLFSEGFQSLNVEPCKPSNDGVVETHLLANFYAAKTDSIRKLGGWDCRLKIWGHEDIFIRAWKAGMKCGFVPSVSVSHFPTSYQNHKSHRERMAEFWPKIAREKFGYKSGNMWPKEFFGVVKVNDGDPIGNWKEWFSGIEDPLSFGEIQSYIDACTFLDAHGLVEDWGCGCAYARRFFRHAFYVGVDGSRSEFCDEVDDLRIRFSRPNGILLRHVLEHNIEWRKLLMNALACATDRIAIVFFMGFTKQEGPHIIDDRNIVTFSLCRSDVLSVMDGWSIEERVVTEGACCDTIWFCSRKK